METRADKTILSGSQQKTPLTLSRPLADAAVSSAGVFGRLGQICMCCLRTYSSRLWYPMQSAL